MKSLYKIALSVVATSIPNEEVNRKAPAEVVEDVNFTRQHARYVEAIRKDTSVFGEIPEEFKDYDFTPQSILLYLTKKHF